MTKNKYHKVVGIIRRRLDEAEVEYDFFEHQAVRTSEEALAARDGYSLEQGAKAIIVRSKKKNEAGETEKSFAMMVMPANLMLSGSRAKKVLQARSVSFASRAEVEGITSGVEFGGIPPFGDVFSLPVYVDERLLQNEKIIFNCGDRRASIAMKTEDYLRIVPHTIADFAELKCVC